ncbi:MAG: hypothetical protein ACREI7_14780, partial [Myxococcota bacterium]
WASGRGHDRRLARGVAWLLLGSVLAGMMVSLAAGGFFAVDDTGAFAVVRLATVCVFAYAILRHRLFDLDLRVKWTVRRGTLVAALAGVFFITKEVLESAVRADGVLSSVAAAAGIGLVAMPAWRFAGRLADRLLPGVADTTEYRTRRRRELYRAAVESAAEGGALSEDEKRLLAGFAKRLGLTPGEARLIDGGIVHGA